MLHFLVELKNGRAFPYPNIGIYDGERLGSSLNRLCIANSSTAAGELVNEMYGVGVRSR